MQPQKDSRAVTSCTECQRRKQKASAVTVLYTRNEANETTSALANGHVTIVRQERSLIFVSLRSKGRSLKTRYILDSTLSDSCQDYLVMIVCAQGQLWI